MGFLIFLIMFNACQSTLEVYINNTSFINTIEDANPAVWTENGIWGPILEDWIIGDSRKSRVTQLIHLQTVYEKNETNVDIHKQDEKESKISPGTKIVNNASGTKKPPRQVTETDMYLLNAIEKLVYKADFMEKRLRRVEEMLYYVMAGKKVEQEPCPDNFHRAGSNCYLFAGTTGRELDWKAANKQCKKYGAVLAEMETIEENQDVVTYIQTQVHLKGREFWTGGLNPGLLWIWSNSARPIKAPGTENKQILEPASTIQGNGRCLRLAYNPGLKSYAYRGTDCAAKNSYICELPENSSTNELRRLGRRSKIIDEL